MTEARRATPADVNELVRLREVMLASMDAGASGPNAWQPAAARVLTSALAEPGARMAAFVVDRPDAPGLASCAVATIEQRLGGPANPAGLVGHVFSVATDEPYRRRGYARRCVQAAIDWYRDNDVRKVGLHASVDGEPLYRSLGFVRNPDPAMRLKM